MSNGITRHLFSGAGIICLVASNMSAQSLTQHGYLVLADISGYTSFVAKTELEHSHEILTELLELLVEKFTPLMVISKLEGDAVFAYAGENIFTRGDTLLEFVESIYVPFP